MGRLTGQAPEPIVALDTGSLDEALRMVDLLGRRCSFYKIGSELFTAAGPKSVEELRKRGADVFLDLKFHDIPNTVAGAVRAAGAIGARLLTVHAAGGAEMLRAAVDAAGDECAVLAVTVLTSIDSAALGSAWGREIPDVATEVDRLAEMAAEAGCRGIVCSGAEALRVRERFAGRVATLVPGIRLPGGDAGDQRRTVTPAQAAAAGATWVVLGRTVTAAAVPAEAMDRVLDDLGGRIA